MISTTDDSANFIIALTESEEPDEVYEFPWVPLVVFAGGAIGIYYMLRRF